MWTSDTRKEQPHNFKQNAQRWIPNLPIGGGVKAEIKAALEAPRKISAYALKTFGELKDKIYRVVTAGAEGVGFFFALAMWK